MIGTNQFLVNLINNLLPGNYKCFINEKLNKEEIKYYQKFNIN